MGGVVSEQVKSRQRVQDHGEVFTNPREVNAMLDMVKQETGRIDSRFLEPACGNGNFISEVLRRKLAVVAARYRKSAGEYCRYVFVAVASIYGVDILADNVAECRERLLDIVKDEARKALRSAPDQQFIDAISYVLNKNILCGDALTMKDAAGEPITFAEWSVVTGDKVKRRDYLLSELLEGSGTKRGDQMGLFQSGWEYDEEIDGLIPSAVREYPLDNWWEVSRRG